MSIMEQGRVGQRSSIASGYVVRWMGGLGLSLGLSIGSLGLAGMGLGAIAQTQPSGSAPTPIQTPSATRPLLRQGSEGAPVRTVQALLSLLGFYQGPVNGTFGESTAIAVTNFQRAVSLEADGIVGPSTWSRLLPSPQSPSASEPAGASPTQPTSAPASSPAASAGDATQSPTPAGSGTTGATGTRPSQEANAQAPAAPPVALPTLRRGMRGPAVVSLQERLRALGTFSGPADGVFGPQTEAAVMAAQRRLRLNPDGIVGAETWSALLR